MGDRALWCVLGEAYVWLIDRLKYTNEYLTTSHVCLSGPNVGKHLCYGNCATNTQSR